MLHIHMMCHTFKMTHSKIRPLVSSYDDTQRWRGGMVVASLPIYGRSTGRHV